MYAERPKFTESIVFNIVSLDMAVIILIKIKDSKTKYSLFFEIINSSFRFLNVSFIIWEEILKHSSSFFFCSYPINQFHIDATLRRIKFVLIIKYQCSYTVSHPRTNFHTLLLGSKCFLLANWSTVLRQMSYHI